MAFYRRRTSYGRPHRHTSLRGRLRQALRKIGRQKAVLRRLPNRSRFSRSRYSRRRWF